MMSSVRDVRVMALAVSIALALTGCVSAVGRGETALRAGRPGEAAQYFGEALAANPDRVDARVGLGIARFRLRAWDAAVATLDPVVAREPGRGDARLYLGLAHLMRGEVSAARDQLTALRALPLHPRIGAQLDRVLPLLVPPLEPALRDLIVADLDDTYEWAAEVARAHRVLRAPFEPAWRVIWDDAYPSALSGPHRGAAP